MLLNGTDVGVFADRRIAYTGQREVQHNLAAINIVLARGHRRLGIFTPQSAGYPVKMMALFSSVCGMEIKSEPVQGDTLGSEFGLAALLVREGKL